MSVLSLSSWVVLVADDDDDFRSILVEHLRDVTSWTILEARNGTEALDLACSQELNALLIDHRMPGLLGAEVVHRLRQQGRDIPTLFITAATDGYTLAQSLGVAGYLAKPFGFAQLTSMLERLQPAPEAPSP